MRRRPRLPARLAAAAVALAATSGGATPTLAQAPPEAEWSIPAPLAPRSLLLDVAQRGDLIVAVGERGHILRSRDGGASWVQAKVPSRALLTGVWLHDERLGWAVGHDETVLRTEDGGESWERVRYEPDAERPLLDVWFRDDRHGIAVGAYGAFLSSDDGGRTWEERPIGEDDYHLNTIAVAADGGLYLAAEAGHIYRSDDGGETWQALDAPYHGSFFGVLPLADGALLAFGLRGNLFRSEDRGATWSEIASGTEATLMTAAELAGGRVIVAGLAGALLRSDDGGRSFRGDALEDRRARVAALPLDGAVLLFGEGGPHPPGGRAMSDHRHGAADAVAPDVRSPAYRLERLVFERRAAFLVLFAIATLFMVWSASRLRIDAGFAKLLPTRHPYVQTYLKHQQEFGGANRVLVALVATNGDMFTPEFFDALRRATDEVFFLPGVDRGRVMSLFTPNVRYTEVIEDGIAAGNVIPDDFETTPEGLAAVRRNILKAGIVGRLVANDFSGALISAELLEVDPTSGERLDFLHVAEQLETKVRQAFDAEFVPGSPVTVHILGFAKVVGDIADGARRVIVFFGVAFLLITLLVALYAQSWRLALVVVFGALVAVAWQVGLIPLLGYGIDPMSILVPFLIFAIAVSHGVQMVSAARSEVFLGADSLSAARIAFRRLLAPSGTALLTDTLGFLTLLVIQIQVIHEIAVAASLGVALILLSNLILLPIVLSYVPYPEDYRQRLMKRAAVMGRLWTALARMADKGPSAAIVAIALVLGAFGFWKGNQVKIGDLHRGVPELRANSRYNRDTRLVTEKFSIGVDILTVIAETQPEGCVDYGIMTTVDEFSWRMANNAGVQSTLDLAGVARLLNAGWNEGSPYWRVLSRNPSVLTQSVAYVPTATGLLNSDCSVLPVMLFTRDHKATTIESIVGEVQRFEAEHGNDQVSFRLATGNVGVMAATNEAVAAAQFPMLAWVFGAVALLCLLTYRSLRGALCVLLPLALVSMLAYALMAFLEIGLKVGTLPVVALGVGIGVDYGIYVYSRFLALWRPGRSVRETYEETLEITGNGVLFTGLTLGLAVATWIFSPLKFQADMGILLCFLFVMNMVGALVLLPALIRRLPGRIRN